MKKMLLSAYLLMPSIVYAQATKTQGEPISTDYMVKLLLSLGLVVGLIFLLAWFVKRFNVMPQQKQGLIKILSSLSVSSRDKIALIQVGEEQILIALSPGKISKLHALTTPINTSDDNKTSFKSKFNSLLDTQKDDTTDTADKSND